MTTDIRHPEAPAAPPQFSDNVTLLQKDGKAYYLIGTAHVSQRSVEEVAHVIQTLRPDTVCVELCATRHQTLTQENQWQKLNVVDVIKQGKALMLLASLALSSFQRKMGDKLGVKPGAELLEGVKQAEAVGAELVLADRDIQVTLKRTWGNLSLWKKTQVIAGLMESVIGSEDISEEELEKMKEKDHLHDMMEEFAKAMPDVKKPLIDERDQYLMSKIEEAPGQTVVAVVGAGHVRGMTRHFGTEIDREAISELPPPSKALKIFTWVFPVLVIGLLIRGLMGQAGTPFVDLLTAWILPNAVFAGLGAIIAGARPLTILTAAVSAPITSLIPVLGAGMVAGLVEGLLRKPTVADCERIPEDINSLRGFYRNPFTRTLLVFFMANTGSAIGTWIGVGWLVSFFT